MSVSRQQRRAAELQQRKNLRKQEKAGITAVAHANDHAPDDRDDVSADLPFEEFKAQIKAKYIARMRDAGLWRDDAAVSAEPSAAPDRPSPQLSEARLAANQANAKLSTGPRTAEGKAASSDNSFKHGLYSKQLVIEGEDPAELDALRADLIAEHQPKTETEALLVAEMADQYWRLRRARRLEVLFLTEGGVIAHLTAAQRIMTTAERGFYKALKTLRELQKQRGSVPQAMETAKPVDIADPQTGSVPQNQPVGAASKATGVGSVPQNKLIGAAGEATGAGFVPQNTMTSSGTSAS